MNKVVRMRDVTFNEYETFNGDLETLKDDMLKIRLDELSKLLQECTIPEESEEPLAQPAQEEPDEIRSLAEDEIQVHETLLEMSKPLSQKMPSVETGFQAYPMPSPTPPAA